MKLKITYSCSIRYFVSIILASVSEIQMFRIAKIQFFVFLSLFDRVNSVLSLQE